MKIELKFSKEGKNGVETLSETEAETPLRGLFPSFSVFRWGNNLERVGRR